MNSQSKNVDDGSARREAVLCHDRTLLVEAGAGTGKTSVMSGRIALMLAEGVEPKSIAAITFTELAASELIERIREYVAELAETGNGGKIPKELEFALPNGLTPEQLANIRQATGRIDEITCTTIHGFCYKLIGIYPAEARIDPGAAVIERTYSDIVYDEIVEDWLRLKLSGEEEGVATLTDFVLNDPERAVGFVGLIARLNRSFRSLKAPKEPEGESLENNLKSFRTSVSEFRKFMDNAEFKEDTTESMVGEFELLASVTEPGSDKGVVGLLATAPGDVLYTRSNAFKQYRMKGKWKDAAKEVGSSAAEAERLFNEASELYDDCCISWHAVTNAAACQVLADLIEKSHEILETYHEDKKKRAQLDFDDLIYLARDLLKSDELVRRELGKRYKYVLVDEFQDTDPVQNEILWRLCGDPPKSGDTGSKWTEYAIRPGALFLVGDPKQAIYRFRGADINAYTTARDNLRNKDPDCLLHINRNFRSYKEILDYVNHKFTEKLSEEGQPGFTPLISNRKAPKDETCVASLDFVVDSEEDARSIATPVREAESEALADFCSQLIGNHQVFDKKGGDFRPCRPGDIALLAPTGTSLWLYENALESRNIPISTQVGKGLFRRQEIQDLIAVTRVLSDSSDTLALGALLRGPLVGLTEEELMDIYWNLPRWEDAPDRIPRLSIHTDSDTVKHDLAKEILEKLQNLHSNRNNTTPHQLLSQAVDELRVRPILRERHRGQVDRALANVDLYLSYSSAYDVRGLRAFSEAMKSAWAEGEQEVEGRPDTKEDAVSLHSIHSAKGLEWPVVIPVNTVTATRSENIIVDRNENTLYCKVLGVEPTGYGEAHAEEKEELHREHVRLFYVAMTRARDMLIIPRPNVAMPKQSWSTLIELTDEHLPAISLPHKPGSIKIKGDDTVNQQSRESFAEEAGKIAEQQTKLEWHAPSMSEGKEESPEEGREILIWREPGENVLEESESVTKVVGGQERGSILHMLMEEVIIGVLQDDPDTLEKRAVELILQLGKTPTEDSAKGLSAKELAESVIRTLNLPKIRELRPGLLAEFPVYSLEKEEDREIAMAGIVDAMTMTDDGKPDVIIDWKSDVKPDPDTLKRYRRQVRDYLDMTGAQKGFIVLMTTGEMVEV